MSESKNVLQVYEAGKLTVLGFGGEPILHEINIAGVRDQIVELLEQHDCEVLAFDLTGVVLVPSGLLGLLASMHKRGLTIHLYNPSKDVVDVLEITQLSQILEVHHVEFDKASDG